MKKLNMLVAAHLKTLGEGQHHDGGGLYLRNRGGSSIWMLRYTSPATDKRSWLSLGKFPDMSLKEAREAAQTARLSVGKGIDVAVAQRAEKAETKRRGVTFKELALDFFETEKHKWSAKNQGGAWLGELRNHVFVKIGSRLASEVDRDLITNTLRPLWNSQNPTAEKALTKIGMVLRHGDIKRLGTSQNEATLARKMLGQTSHVERAHGSLAYWRVPDLYATLGTGTPHLGLRFLILTAGIRAGNVRAARWEQIKGDVWEVPRVTMKTKGRGRNAPHAIPLSDAALAVLKEARQFSDDSGLIFPRPSAYKTGMVSDAAWGKWMRDNNWLEELTPDDRALGQPIRAAVPHGFRHSFANWGNAGKVHDRFLIETILDHAVRDGEMGTYWTSQITDQMRPILNDWALFVTGQKTAKVVPIIQNA